MFDGGEAWPRPALSTPKQKPRPWRVTDGRSRAESGGTIQEASVISILATGPVGSRLIGSLREKDLARFRDELLGEGYSLITIKRRFAIVSHIYKIAPQEWGLGVL